MEAELPEWSPLECFDAGRSRRVRSALERALADIRDEVAGLRTAAVFCGLDSGSFPVHVLALSTDDPDLGLFPNEPLAAETWMSTRRATRLPTISLSSALRAHKAEVKSALVVPRRSQGARILLLLGFSNSVMQSTRARQLARRIRDAHTLAALRGSNALRAELEHAAQAVSSVAAKPGRSETVLDEIVTAARRLLGTSTAYVKLPDDRDFYTLAAASNIRTAAFRRGGNFPGGQGGLGGLVADLGHPIVTFDYTQDHRLADPIRVAETRREGLVSAICSPLIVDRVVVGLLYVANRKLTAFTPGDAKLLQMFADLVAPLLGRAEAERQRLEAMSRIERERLAFDFHESVVRSLVAIGFHSETAELACTDDDTRRRLAEISTMVQESLSSVREQLARLTSYDEEDTPPHVGEIMELLSREPAHAGAIPRSFAVTGGRPGRRVPRSVASALLIIGQEALHNADCHSRAKEIKVTLEIGRSSIGLVVEDDGVGIEPVKLEAALEAQGHFGLRRIRRAVGEVGGTIDFAPRRGGGLSVRAEIPIP